MDKISQNIRCHFKEKKIPSFFSFHHVPIEFIFFCSIFYGLYSIGNTRQEYNRFLHFVQVSNASFIFFYIFVFLGLLLWNTFVYTTNLDKYLFFSFTQKKKNQDQEFSLTQKNFLNASGCHKRLMQSASFFRLLSDFELPMFRNKIESWKSRWKIKLW